MRPSDLRTPLSHALYYAEQGWAVFPVHYPVEGRCSCGNPDCGSPAKHPLTEHGYKDATTDPGKIRGWWIRWPGANVAIVTGAASQLIVLDVDGEEGRESVKGFKTPETPVATTGKGTHFYFRHPGGEVRNFARKLPGVDLRGDGGYVVAPPSNHITGRVYEWATPPGVEPAEPPDWLMSLLRGPKHEHTPPPPDEQKKKLLGNLRPCFYAMCHGEGPAVNDGNIIHDARIALVAEAQYHRATIPVITSLFEGCNDFNPEITERAVRGLAYQNLAEGIQRWGCETVRERGWCPLEDINDCHFYRIVVKEATAPPPDLANPENIDPGRYFKMVNEKPQFQPDVMVQDVTQAYKMITFTDTEQSYRYNPETGTYVDDANPTIKKFVMAALKKYFKKSYAEEVIYQVQIKTYANRDTLTPPPEMLNLQNGILNIRIRELLPHTPDYFFLNCSPTVYDPDAEAPEFKKLLDFLACKKEITLQEFCGYLLLSSAKYKKAGFIYGPTDGAKTTFTNAILNVLGSDAVCGIAIQNLDKRFQAQRLYGKRVNMYSDLGAEAFSSVAMFKRTTGGDVIESEIKGKNRPLSFIWTGKHWFDANELPKATGGADTDAFYNRLLLFPFSRQVPKNQIDRGLPDQLAAEASGVLNWMLEGLDHLEENQGFTDQTDIEEIKIQYKRAADTVYCFAQDCCMVVQGEYVPKTDSHTRYVTYCVEQGFSPRGRTKFYEELQTNLPGITTDRKKVGGETPQVWMNLVIKDALPRQPDADLTSFTRNTTNPAYTPTGGIRDNPGVQEVGFDRSHSPSSCNGGVSPGSVYAKSVVTLVRLVEPPSENPNVEHLKRVAEGYLKRAGYATRVDFFNVMYEAGHRDREVILSVLKQDPRYEITDSGIRWVEVGGDE